MSKDRLMSTKRIHRRMKRCERSGHLFVASNKDGKVFKTCVQCGRIFDYRGAPFKSWIPYVSYTQSGGSKAIAEEELKR